MRYLRLGVAFLLLLLVFGDDTPVKAQTAEPQLPIARVEQMPSLPQPLRIKDWKQVTIDCDRIAFDLSAKGQYLPLLWLDDSRTNYPWTSFGLPSYVGVPARPGGEEGITCLSAVLSASLVGIDKTRGPHNWVLMAEQFYNKANGQDVVLNGYSARTGGSFWYDLWPGILFDGLAYCYPNVPSTNVIMRASADRWWAATEALTDKNGTADFDHTAFDLATMKPVDNGRWKEPDGAAGVACLEYLAYARYGDGKYLQAADSAERFLASRSEDPLYELLLPYGAYTAARMDAELGRSYDVGKLLDWSFGPSQARPGWGVIVGNWVGEDCDGLAGSLTDSDGYAFAMNTFTMAGALVPLVRYDQRYARAVGKWMLNAANAARLFYPDALPAANQSCAGWAADPRHCIAYEGLRRHGTDARGLGQTPYATGDAQRSHWAPTDFGVYGSAHVGFFGGIITRTNDPAILQLDCLKTDFFHRPAYPTYLYYNPDKRQARITIQVAKRSAVYDLVTHRFLSRNVTGKASFVLPANAATVVVLTPASGNRQIRGHILYINGIGVDFRVHPQ